MSDLRDSHLELLCALQEAMRAVRTFHGESGWAIYENHAPEWQRWTRVRDKALELRAQVSK